jgi:hypothetical protein
MTGLKVGDLVRFPLNIQVEMNMSILTNRFRVKSIFIVGNQEAVVLEPKFRYNGLLSDNCWRYWVEKINDTYMEIKEDFV